MKRERTFLFWLGIYILVAVVAPAGLLIALALVPVLGTWPGYCP